MNTEDYETWGRGGVSPTLNAFDNATETRATVCITGDVTHALTSEGHDASEDGTGRGNPIVPTDPIHGDVSPALGANAYIGAHVSAGVRRLTPVECERLMGCPDDWTRYRIDEKKGEVVEQADSSRYRQCGNGLVVDVMEWVVGRIQDVAQ